ncbi:MAG TPA: hypothetical protein VGH28_00260 [Polyangiaceae bacterium]|jgi:hypothetical protein
MRKRIEKVSAAVATIALAVVILACKKGEGGECIKNKDCKTELLCYESKCTTAEDIKKQCQASESCSNMGNCGLGYIEADTAAQCVAKSDDDCKGSKLCKENGFCTFSGHMCVK